MIAVGVDTHKHRHTAVALSPVGELLGELEIPAVTSGYRDFREWIRGLGEPATVGIEGTGSYGAGLCHHLQQANVPVVEVERPRRQERRAGKSDRIDALHAARRVLAGDGLSTPRQAVEQQALRALLVAYRSVVEERTRVLNQLQAVHTTAPACLRERIGTGNGRTLARRLNRMRARPALTADERVVFAVLRDLARRARFLETEARRYEHELRRIVEGIAPTLLHEPGVGPISAAKLIVFDVRRFKHEAAFARGNGTAPLPASSGTIVRYRLSRSGDRQINLAIHTIALSRSRHDPETRAYLARRISDGKTKREAMRSLKRHLSRRLYKQLAAMPLTP